MNLDELKHWMVSSDPASIDKLFAAIPELIARAERAAELERENARLREALSALVKKAGPQPYYLSDQEYRDRWLAALESARAALEKASGDG